MMTWWGFFWFDVGGWIIGSVKESAPEWTSMIVNRISICARSNEMQNKRPIQIVDDPSLHVDIDLMVSKYAI